MTSIGFLVAILALVIYVTFKPQKLQKPPEIATKEIRA